MCAYARERIVVRESRIHCSHGVGISGIVAKMATHVLAFDNAKRKVLDLAFTLVPAALFLAGCANGLHSDVQSKEDRAAAEQVAKDISTIDDARCQSYGFQPSSPRYVQCRKDIDSERRQMSIKE
jgi:hypothetical protein